MSRTGSFTFYDPDERENMIRRAAVAILSAAALAVPAAAEAIPIHVHKTVWYGGQKWQTVVVKDVAPADRDDDGVADRSDECPKVAGTDDGCPLPTPDPAPVADDPVEATTYSAGAGGSTVQCESGGDYGAYDPSGTYWGGWQFDQSTWNAYNVAGGEWGSATPAQQDAAAAAVPYDAWPNC